MTTALKTLIIFLPIWIAGAYIADHVLMLGASPWRMVWGYFCGTIGLTVAHEVASRRWLP